MTRDELVRIERRLARLDGIEVSLRALAENLASIEERLDARCDKLAERIEAHRTALESDLGVLRYDLDGKADR